MSILRVPTPKGKDSLYDGTVGDKVGSPLSTSRPGVLPWNPQTPERTGESTTVHPLVKDVEVPGRTTSVSETPL